MKIVILGAGAVGGYFGGKIALKGYPVTFLVRENRFNALKKHGLIVKSLHADFSIEPTLAKTVSEIEQPDLVIVALKNYHLQAALPQIEQLVQKGAKVLPLLNGIGHLDMLTARLGEENVLGGLCYVESTLNEHGEIVQTSPMQDIVFGPLAGDMTSFHFEIEKIMEDAGISVRLAANIKEEMWKKYIFLTSLSGITAGTRQPIGVALKDDTTLAFLKGLIEEISTVALSCYDALADDTAEQVLLKMQQLSQTMTSSMHRDLENGYPIEIEALHGYLIKVAQEKDISIPCVRAIYSLLHPYKNGAIELN